MKKRNWITILTAVLILCMLLPIAASAQTTITFAFWGSADETTMKLGLIDLYMEKHPDVTIDAIYTIGDEYTRKLQTLFAANTPPDIMGTASDIIYPYRSLGVFEDLAPYMERDGLDFNIWNPIAVDIFKDADGKILAAPYIYKIPAIIYNKTIFDAAGLEYPSKDWTEAEMIDLAQKLTTGTGRDKIFGINLGWWPTALYRNLYGNPVYKVNERQMNAVGNEQFKDALQFFVTLIRDLGVAPNETDISSGNIGGGFETGKFAMAVTAPWEMENFSSLIGDRFEWEIVPLPVSEKWGPWYGNLFLDGYTISSTSQNKDAAWEFIKFLTTDPEAQAISSQHGVPMLTSYANSEAYLNEFYGNKPYDKLVFVEMLDRATGWESTDVWAQINDEVVNQYQMVINNKIDLDTAIANIQEAGEKLLK